MSVAQAESISKICDIIRNLCTGKKGLGIIGNPCTMDLPISNSPKERRVMIQLRFVF